MKREDVVLVEMEQQKQHAGDHPATLVPTDLVSSDCDVSVERRSESEADKTPDEQEILENAQLQACHETESNGECHAEVCSQERTTNA